MKNLFALILGSSLIIGAVNAEDSRIRRVPGDRDMCLGGFYPNPVWVEDSKIEWDSSSSALPISPPEASKLAVEAFHKRMSDYMPMKVSVSNERLLRIGDSWCYAITIHFHRSDQTLVGVPFWACAYVRMDGTAYIEPSILLTPEPSGFLLDRDKKKPNKAEMATPRKPSY